MTAVPGGSAFAGYMKAAAGGSPAAASGIRSQCRLVSSARPCWYAASRDISSASS